MKLHRNTVSDLLWNILTKLMSFEELKTYRLVGGTSLSLLLGHRKSADIDLFTDSGYDLIDFNKLDKLFVESFDYVNIGYGGNKGFGKSYYIGSPASDAIKLDLFYTDPFILPIIEIENIRLSQLGEIVAMKLEIIGQNGRKKDFWDIHELMNHFTWSEMLDFFLKRYPFSHKREDIIRKLTDFTNADMDPDPICLKDKYWELIKIDIEESIKNFRQSGRPPH